MLWQDYMPVEGLKLRIILLRITSNTLVVPWWSPGGPQTPGLYSIISLMYQRRITR